MKAIFVFIFFLFNFALAKSLDQELKEKINFFSIKSIPNHVPIKNRFQIELGQKIFSSSLISGNRNISCITCHNPKLGTSDQKRLSQTFDGKSILKRNSPHLYNVGLPSHNFMFWDGRVHFNPINHIFDTPEMAFNGKNPSRFDITLTTQSALSMQVLFPMISFEEMRGNIGDNEIANAKNNLEAWDLILKRIQNDKDLNHLLIKSYPGVIQFNIGHIGEALAQFIAEEFHANNTPVHQYLNGNLNALSPQEKRGFLIFMDKGKCISCHQGGEFGLNSFFTSVGIPQYGARPFELDLGRGKITKESFKNLFFKVPSLINLKVTSPYMHNGAYRTIRDVINHYSNIKIFLDSYEINSSEMDEFPVELDVLNDANNKNLILNSIEAPFLKNGLNLREDEKDDLEAFLTNGLMDPKFEKHFVK